MCKLGVIMVSDDADLIAVENAYVGMENDLQRQIDNIPSAYPARATRQPFQCRTANEASRSLSLTASFAALLPDLAALRMWAWRAVTRGRNWPSGRRAGPSGVQSAATV